MAPKQQIDNVTWQHIYHWSIIIIGNASTATMLVALKHHLTGAFPDVVIYTKVPQEFRQTFRHN